jgi:hypothetical protein
MKFIYCICIFFFCNSVSIAQTNEICSPSNKYFEFARFLKRKGEDIKYSGNIYSCIFYSNLMGLSQDDVPGFYALRSGSVHAPSYIFVQYPNGKRYYLHQYKMTSFIRFIDKHIRFLYQSDEYCVVYEKLISFWCIHNLSERF